MKVDANELVRGLDSNKKFLLDVNGQVYSVDNYIKQYHIGVQKQINDNLIPFVYDKPLGIQMELTSKCFLDIFFSSYDYYIMFGKELSYLV